MGNYFCSYANEVLDALKNMSALDKRGESLEAGLALELWADKAKETRDHKGVFFFIGNGASATMAEHMSHDCFQNADMYTQTCSETAHITAISNDISYEDVFSYRINKTMTQKDMLIAISSSGNSPNIIKAIHAARGKGSFIVTLTGMNPENKARGLGDLNLYVPLSTYGTVESAHSVLLHCWLDYFMDKHMGGRH